MKILVTAPFPAHLIDKIKAVSPSLEVEQWLLPDGHWPDDKTTNAEIYYAISSVPRPDQAPNLRWVQAHWAGIDRLIDTSIWNSDIAITSASGIHAPNMAQYAMTQILSWAHRVPNWFRYQRLGKWPQGRWDKFVPDELDGRTLGIVGYGSIGREIARLAKPFGLKILVSKRDARQPKDSGYVLPGTGDPHGEIPERIYPSEATRSMLTECDFIIVTLPLTENTHHFFNEVLFKEMKSNAFLVNIGRGSVINEPDLIKALKKGWLAGAGLDVFESEPLPEDSPLWMMDNVILTPHISGFTEQYDERVTDLFAKNLQRYLAGKKPLNLINRMYGY